jgi:hypothetical protein
MKIANPYSSEKLTHRLSFKSSNKRHYKNLFRATNTFWIRSREQRILRFPLFFVFQQAEWVDWFNNRRLLDAIGLTWSSKTGHPTVKLFLSIFLLLLHIGLGFCNPGMNAAGQSG